MDLLEQMFGQKEETDEMSLYDQHAYIDHNEYKKRFTKVIHNTRKNLAVFFLLPFNFDAYYNFTMVIKFILVIKIGLSNLKQ